MTCRTIEIACKLHPDEQVVWPDGVAYCSVCGNGHNLDERTTDDDGVTRSVEWGTHHYADPTPSILAAFAVMGWTFDKKRKARREQGATQ